MYETPYILEVTAPMGKLLTPIRRKENAFTRGSEWFDGPCLFPGQKWALDAWLECNHATQTIFYRMIETPTTAGTLDYTDEEPWTTVNWRVLDQDGRPVDWNELDRFFNPEE